MSGIKEYYSLRGNTMVKTLFCVVTELLSLELQILRFLKWKSSWLTFNLLVTATGCSSDVTIIVVGARLDNFLTLLFTGASNETANFKAIATSLCQ